MSKSDSGKIVGFLKKHGSIKEYHMEFTFQLRKCKNIGFDNQPFREIWDLIRNF